jgi:hypothetical protein
LDRHPPRPPQALSRTRRDVLVAGGVPWYTTPDRHHLCYS